MRLVTKRLILRKPEKKDVKDLVEGLNDLEISRYIPLMPHPYKRKDALNWIKTSEKNLKQKKPEKLPFNIELKLEKKIIGGIGLHEIDYFAETANIGYWINRKYWKKGIISEAVKVLLDFGFYKLGLRRMGLIAYRDNVASNKVAKKFGFKLEGILRKSLKAKATGKIHDANTYGLLKEEWIKVRKNLK